MSVRSRVAGYRKGWKRIKDHWDDLKVEAIEAPATLLDLDYSKSGGIWSLNSTIQFPKTAEVNLESGLTLTNSFTAGSIANNNINRSVDVVFACDITLPGTFNTDGVLFEMGGTGTGAGVGIISSGSTLIVAAGDGAATSSSTTAAIAQIATSGLTPGDSGTLIWEFRINPGRVRVWWKGTLIATESTTDGSALESSTWSGTDGGGYGQVNNSLVTVLTSGNWPGSTNSSLRYYQSQLITA